MKIRKLSDVTAKWPNMSGVEAALAEYYADGPRRDTLWKTTQTDSDVFAAQAADREAEDKVRRAFLEATKDRNTWSQVKVVGMDFVQRCVDAWKRQVSEMS